jgi:outer membrane protein assembly factor BamB
VGNRHWTGYTTGSFDKTLHAINPNGAKKWTFASNNNLYAAPLIGADGTIYIGSTNKNLYAINPDGTIKWEYSINEGEEGITSTPAIGSDGTVYTSTFGGKLYALGTVGAGSISLNNISINLQIIPT